METALRQTRKNKNYCAHLKFVFAVPCFVVAVTPFCNANKIIFVVAEREGKEWFILYAILSCYSNYHTTWIIILYQLFSRTLWVVTCYPSRGIQKNLLEVERSGLTLSKFIHFLYNVMKLDSGLSNSSSFSLWVFSTGMLCGHQLVTSLSFTIACS